MTELNDMAVFGALMSVIAVLGVIAIIFYLIDAIGRYKYLKVRNYSSPVLAFIPIANIYATVEATYGTVEKIKLYGVEFPSFVVKLFPLITSAVAGALSRIPGIGTQVSSILGIVTIGFMAALFMDVMKCIKKDVSLPFAVIASFISIVGSIMLLVSCKDLQSGQYDYREDKEPLPSQTRTTFGI